MTVSVASLQKLMSLGLTTEQMAGVIDVLAVELAPLETIRAEMEERRSKDRERKFRGKSKERSTEIPNKESFPHTPFKEKPTNVGLPPIVPLSEPEGFDAFWQAYPKRDGNADRKGAVKAFGAAAKRADGHEVLIRAAARYAAHCRDKGKIGTEFVKQARSWLNGDLWREWVPQEPVREVSETRVYVPTGTDAMDAWASYFKRTKGKMAPRDQRGGWYFPTEYPSQEQAA